MSRCEFKWSDRVKSSPEVKGYKMSRCELSGLIELSHHQKLKVIKCLVAN